MTERTPWAAMLNAALRFGVPPHHFWRLSLREWRGLMAPRDEALSRAAFAELARRFPDNPHD